MWSGNETERLPTSRSGHRSPVPNLRSIIYSPCVLVCKVSTFVWGTHSEDCHLLVHQPIRRQQRDDSARTEGDGMSWTTLETMLALLWNLHIRVLLLDTWSPVGGTVWLGWLWNILLTFWSSSLKVSLKGLGVCPTSSSSFSASFTWKKSNQSTSGPATSTVAMPSHHDGLHASGIIIGNKPFFSSLAFSWSIVITATEK